MLAMSLAIWAVNDPYGHAHWYCQSDCFGYSVKTHAKINSYLLDSAQKVFPFKSYSCLKFFGHSKNGTFPPNLPPPEILRENKKRFGNGMV